MYAAAVYAADPALLPSRFVVSEPPPRHLSHGQGADIECVSASGKFPSATNPHDYVIQVSTTFQRYGEPEPYHRAVTCLRETAPVDGVQIVWSDREEDVITRWAEMLREHSVDVLLTYNGAQARVSGRVCLPFQAVLAV